MSKETTLYQYESDYEPVGLKNGGHNLIRCSACDVPLVDIWITQPQLDLEWTIKAMCAHCGDASFHHKVKGGFHIGNGVEGNPEEDSDNEDNVYSSIANIDHKDGIVIVETTKVREYDARNRNRVR